MGKCNAVFELREEDYKEGTTKKVEGREGNEGEGREGKGRRRNGRERGTESRKGTVWGARKRKEER